MQVHSFTHPSRMYGEEEKRESEREKMLLLNVIIIFVLVMVNKKKFVCRVAFYLYFVNWIPGKNVREEKENIFKN